MIYRADYTQRNKDIRKPTDRQQRDLLNLRRRLEEGIQNHFADYAKLHPAITAVGIKRSAAPEKQDLRLPSAFALEERKTHGLEELARMETRLRVGQCYDWLKKLRDALGLKGVLQGAKRAHIVGYQATTRSAGRVHRATQMVERAASLYRLSWTAATRLKDPEVVKAEMEPLRELHMWDLRPLQTLIIGGRFNPNDKPVSWIWSISAAFKNMEKPERLAAIENWSDEGAVCGRRDGPELTIDKQ